MRILNLLILSLLFSNVFAQDIAEKKIQSKVNEVTVFLDGAQVTRKKNADLKTGKQILRFENLSPFIDAKSLQVKVNGAITVLSVNHQKNYLKELKKSEELNQLENKLELLDDKIKLEHTHLSIIKEELEFLQVNRDIGGKNEQVSISNLQQASEYYSKKLTSLKLKEVERNKTLKDLNEKRASLFKQMRTLQGKKEYPAGEILVKVDVKRAGIFKFSLSYLVKNASWFPTYDIRAKNINEPIQLIYKANVKQDTKVDWKNVKLKFSSAAPNQSGVAPELKTYYLDYYSAPPRYDMKANTVSGRVVDEEGLGLPGVSVVVEGTTIGAATDMDGNYTLTLPANANQLRYSFVGMVEQTLPIRGSVMNVQLEYDTVAVDEVVVTGYSGGVAKALRGKVSGVNTKKSKMSIRGTSSLAMPVEQVENQTTVDFAIERPYTINSDSKSLSVDMAHYNLPASYQYYCVPKVDKDAFLIANVLDWEKYNLLEGEANVFFEDTYVGKTILDVRFVKDTLEISLGRDKKVSVHREKLKDYTQRKFIGKNKEENRVWKTTVRNNKQESIQMLLLDQVPVSRLAEIEVNVEEVSGAKTNKDTGEIKWEFKLDPGNSKKVELKYSVKYPKNRNLTIE